VYPGDRSWRREVAGEFEVFLYGGRRGSWQGGGWISHTIKALGGKERWGLFFYCFALWTGESDTNISTRKNRRFYRQRGENESKAIRKGG